MERMKNVFFLFASVLIGFQTYGQSNMATKASWVDTMRNYLVLDSTHCQDSIISFEAYNKIFEISITRKRPNFRKALNLIDSIAMDLENDSTFARLMIILLEFDSKYLSEFVYSVDYFQNSYHITKTLHQSNSTSRDTNELLIFEKLEDFLHFSRMIRSEDFDLIECLVDEKNQNGNNFKPYSRTWQLWGGFDISLFKKYLIMNDKTYNNEIRSFLNENITEKIVYRVINRFALFDWGNINNIDCDRISRLIDRSSSPILIDALKGLESKFHNNQSCLTNIIKTIDSTF